MAVVVLCMVYLKYSENNNGDTEHVLQAFLGAFYKFGLPSRVRCDKGVRMQNLSHRDRCPGEGRATAERNDQTIQYKYIIPYHVVLTVPHRKINTVHGMFLQVK